MAKSKYDWSAIRRAFVETPEPVSLTDLAKQCGAEMNTVWRRSKAENWQMERARFQARVEEQHQDKKVEALAQQGATWDAECLASARALRESAMLELAKGGKARDVAAALKIAQEMGKAALGDKPNGDLSLTVSVREYVESQS